MSFLNLCVIGIIIIAVTDSICGVIKFYIEKKEKGKENG